MVSARNILAPEFKRRGFKTKKSALAYASSKGIRWKNINGDIPKSNRAYLRKLKNELKKDREEEKARSITEIPRSEYEKFGFDSKRGAIRFAEEKNITWKTTDEDFLQELRVARNVEFYRLKEEYIDSKIDEFNRNVNKPRTEVIVRDKTARIPGSKIKMGLDIYDLIHITQKVEHSNVNIPLVTINVTIGEGENSRVMDVVYTLNEKLVESLINSLTEDDYTYDESLSREMYNYIKLVWVPKKREGKYRKNAAGFFPYFIRDGILEGEISESLMKYQIFRRTYVKKTDKPGTGRFVTVDGETKIVMGETVESSVPVLKKQENCVIHSLRESGLLSKEVLSELSMKCRNSHIPFKNIREIAEGNDVTIYIKTEKYNRTFGKNDEKVIRLGYVEDHCFLIEKTGIAAYPLKGDNIEKLIDQPEWWKITNKKGEGYERKSDVSRFLDSYNLIKALIENYQKYKGTKYCIMEEMTVCDKLSKIDEIGKLDIETMVLPEKPITRNKKKEKEEVEEKKKKALEEKTEEERRKTQWKEAWEMYMESKKVNYMIGFDFETNTGGKIHEPYLVSYNITKYTKRNNKKEVIVETKHIVSEHCAIKLLEEVNQAIEEDLVNVEKEFRDCIEELYQTHSRRSLMSISVPETRDRLVDMYMGKNRNTNKYVKKIYVAHNITYDIQFLMKHVYNVNLIKRGSANSVCGGQFMFGDHKYNIRDTYAIMDCKLSDFKQYFGLDMKKEVMPYQVYNSRENLEKKSFDIWEAVDLLFTQCVDRMYPEKKINKQIITFLDNIDKWGLSEDGETYDHLKYSAIYCDRDVDVMMAGYNIFRSWVKKICKHDLFQNRLELFDFLTISSLADGILEACGCYVECDEIGGVARYMIQQTIVGGRCMSRKNKQYNGLGNLNDFDATSLYPSAMYRLLTELGGFLKGKPKLLSKDQLNHEFLKTVDGYFIEVKMPKIEKSKQKKFPLNSYVDKNGIRCFTDDVEGMTFYMCRIQLEDFINFYGIEPSNIEILQGYYYDQGRNGKIGDTMKMLFNERVKKKDEGNPIQQLYKLIMNSAYGKTIMKEVSKTTKYVESKEKMEDYMVKNHNTLCHAEKLHDCDRYIIETRKSFLDHYNKAHIGSEILAMSKRIMNEVMCLAEEHGIDIYYQDTDSMHIDNDKVAQLGELFKEKYGRELIGKDMGQFHCDFEKLKINGVELPAVKTTVSKVLAKKAYIDRILHKDKEGKKYYSIHYRMKGCPHNTLDKIAREQFRGDETIDYDNHECELYREDLVKLYDYLLDGGSLALDISLNNTIFKTNKNHTVNTVSDFTRTLSFKRKD